LEVRIHGSCTLKCMSVYMSPIYAKAHTVPQKCRFWGEIRGQISQKNIASAPNPARHTGTPTHCPSISRRQDTALHRGEEKRPKNILKAWGWGVQLKVRMHGRCTLKCMSVCSSPINDKAHTVPQKCRFGGEIRGQISKKNIASAPNPARHTGTPTHYPSISRSQDTALHRGGGKRPKKHVQRVGGTRGGGYLPRVSTARATTSDNERQRATHERQPTSDSQRATASERQWGND
jgi:hypothetical protein